MYELIIVLQNSLNNNIWKITSNNEKKQLLINEKADKLCDEFNNFFGDNFGDHIYRETLT